MYQVIDEELFSLILKSIKYSASRQLEFNVDCVIFPIKDAQNNISRSSKFLLYRSITCLSSVHVKDVRTFIVILPSANRSADVWECLQ